MSIPAASQTLFVAKEGAKLFHRRGGPGWENQSTLDPAPSDHLSNDNSSRCNLGGELQVNTLIQTQKNLYTMIEAW